MISPRTASEEGNMSLDRVDRRLLEVLQREGRLSNVALAERVHLSPSPCLRRLKALEHDGVIDGYRAVLDREAVGLGLTAFVELKVEGHSDRLAEAIQEAVAEMPEVVACHIVSGAADFLLEVVVPDLRAYERFLLGSLLKLPSVADVRSNFAIRTVKAPGPLPLGHLD
jgi:Lrp/AsnC family transcriptional regulator, leucine-responsive regulatory protein